MIKNFATWLNESAKFCEECSLPIIGDFENEDDRAENLCHRCLEEKYGKYHPVDKMRYKEACNLLLSDNAVKEAESILKKYNSLAPTIENYLNCYKDSAIWRNNNSLRIDGDLRLNVEIKNICDTVYNDEPVPERFKELCKLFSEFIKRYEEIRKEEIATTNPYSKGKSGSISDKKRKIDAEINMKKELSDDEWNEVKKLDDEETQELINILRDLYAEKRNLKGKEEEEEALYKIKKEKEISVSDIDKMIDDALDRRNFEEVKKLVELKDKIKKR